MSFEKLWSKIYGNEILKKNFINEIADGHLAHAYIFEGSEGSGKTLLAFTVSAALAGNDFLADRIFNGFCSDIRVIDLLNGRKTIGVESVREIKNTVFIKPNDVDFKVYIIKNSDLMTVQAQNALLKILEEPPEDTYFFLLCRNVSSLLPTVRSRAPTVKLQNFSNSDLSDYVLKNVKGASELKSRDPDEFDCIISMSGGTIGKAKELIENSSDDKKSEILLREKVADFVGGILSSDPLEIQKRCLTVPGAREDFVAFISLSAICIRDVIALRLDENADAVSVQKKRISEIPSKVRIPSLIELYDIFAKATADASANLNVSNLKALLAADIINVFKK